MSSGACPSGNTAIAGTVALTTISSLGLAFSDVLVDAIVVSKSRGGDQGRAGALQSLCWSSSSVGALLSAYFSGSFVENFGPSWVFGVTSIFPLITAGVSFLIKEEPVSASPKLVHAPGMQLAGAEEDASADGPEWLVKIKQQFGALW